MDDDADQNFVDDAAAEQKGQSTINEITNSWRRSDQVSNIVLFLGSKLSHCSQKFTFYLEQILTI